MDKIFLYLEILFIAIAIIAQFASFIKTRAALKKFGNNVKSAFRGVSLESMPYDQDSLDDPDEMKRLINCEDAGDEESDDVEPSSFESIDLINSPVLRSGLENDYRSVITSTNSYLVKNRGIASDFGILRDICERRIESDDAQLADRLSTPLYLGLCGTFVGIVCGLLGFVKNGFATDGLNGILAGVSIAMVASLLGLVLTLINKAIIYPRCTADVDSSKNEYYDFLQRELMPSLSLGVAGSLASFKDVLGSFISKFGNNISGYAETARLMNQNLESEHLVLQEINNLNITKVSNAIAESFITLKESSQDLAKFKEYQTALNATMERASAVAGRIESIIDTFNGFVSTLDKVAKQADETNLLQQQFKESLETHFPTIEEHENIWRQQIDSLGEDAKRSSEELQQYLKSSTEYIRNFVGDNTTFLSGLLDMKDAVEAVKQNADQQTAIFDAYRTSMDSLKQSIDRLYDADVDNQNSVTAALKGMLEKNTNPQYENKLREINEALGRLQSEREELKTIIADVQVQQTKAIEELASKVESNTKIGK